MHIDYQDRTQLMTKEQMTLLEDLLQYVAEQEQVQTEAEVSISFVDNKEIKQINKDYRNKDCETDVISFAFLEEVEGAPHMTSTDDMPIVLGDIIISVETAVTQAENYNHSLERELGFLCVHGLLHLLGYDHMTKEDEKVMIKKQEDFLNGFGLSRI